VAEKRRLFFALWPDDGLRAAIAQASEAAATAAGIRGRPTPQERIHMTLLFLGDVAAEDEPRVMAAAGRVRSRAFELVLDQVGSFNRSRVLWVGTRRAPAALTDLWRGLREALGDLALEHNRLALAPHVTCLRDTSKPLKPTPIEPMSWRVREFVLAHSAPGAKNQGPAYHLVSHWPLQTVPAA
jgi:RNA 2',3'-cyclic 3'-phosphodiesterase